MTIKRSDLGVAPDGMLVCKLCREPLGYVSGGDLSGIYAMANRAEKHSCKNKGDDDDS